MDAPFPDRRRAAVCLTYDDALACHRAEVAPALAARGLRGTFFVPAAYGDLHDQVAAWRAVAAAGHELGNHTCFHPCRARDGAAWPDPAYDLRRYSRRRIADELRLADRVLRLVDGRERRVFAATCGHLACGADGAEEDFTDDLRPFTTLVRSGRAGVLPLASPPFVAGSVGCDGRSAAEVIADLEPLLDQDGFALVLTHGVGRGTHSLFMETAEHVRLLDWLATHRERIWGATVSGVVERLAG